MGEKQKSVSIWRKVRNLGHSWNISIFFFSHQSLLVCRFSLSVTFRQILSFFPKNIPHLYISSEVAECKWRRYILYDSWSTSVSRKCFGEYGIRKCGKIFFNKFSMHLFRGLARGSFKIVLWRKNLKNFFDVFDFCKNDFYCIFRVSWP